MKSYLIDTSAILAHYRLEAGADRVQAILEEEDAEVLISAVSVAELARRLTTLGADPSAARATALEYVGLASRVVAVDTEISIRAFELGARCSRRVPLIDTLIAACAACSSAILVHRDPHFDQLPPSLMLIEAL